MDSPVVIGRTEEALYAEIDLELSWPEEQLPQIARTKHATPQFKTSLHVSGSFVSRDR